MRFSETLATVIVAAIFAVFSVGLWACASYFEARAFNRVTGKNVSTVDAMFIQLRVQESLK